MLGVRVGGHQRQRGEVVAGDPGGGVGVEHVGPVPQPQPEPAVAPAESDRQHGVLGEVAAVAGRVEHGLERRPGQAQLARSSSTGSPGAPAAPPRPAGVAQQLPPGAGRGRQPARQRPPPGAAT